MKESKGCNTNSVNDWITFLSGIGLIINIAITATSVSINENALNTSTALSETPNNITT